MIKITEESKKELQDRINKACSQDLGHTKKMSLEE